MPTWPAYAQVAAGGYTEQAQPKVARTEADDGYVKQTRVRSHALVVRPITVPGLTDEEKRQFAAWVGSDLNAGAAWFDWPDPSSGQTRRARIREGVVNYQAATERPRTWDATLELETYE